MQLVETGGEVGKASFMPVRNAHVLLLLVRCKTECDRTFAGWGDVSVRWGKQCSFKMSRNEVPKFGGMQDKERGRRKGEARRREGEGAK